MQLGCGRSLHVARAAAIDGGVVMRDEEALPMLVPAQIPIAYEPGYWTDCVGDFDGGRFLGLTFFLAPRQLKPVAVLHRFDDAGRHTRSNAHAATSINEAAKWLDDQVARLANPRRGPIAVRTFKVQLLGKTFGMVLRRNRGVEYVPAGLLFCPPWDGTYDT